MASRSWIVCLVLAKSQMAGLAAAKGWNASLGLHQGTPRPSSPAELAIAKAAASRGQIFQKVDYATFSRIIIMVRQAKLARSSRWETGTGKAVAGCPVASVA